MDRLTKDKAFRLELFGQGRHIKDLALIRKLTTRDLEDGRVQPEGYRCYLDRSLLDEITDVTDIATKKGEIKIQALLSDKHLIKFTWRDVWDSENARSMCNEWFISKSKQALGQYRHGYMKSFVAALGEEFGEIPV